MLVFCSGDDGDDKDDFDTGSMHIFISDQRRLSASGVKTKILDLSEQVNTQSHLRVIY